MQANANITLDKVIDQLRTLPPAALPVALAFTEYLASLYVPGQQSAPVETSKSWPPAFFEETFGTTPEIVERPSQGHFETRDYLA